MSTVHRSSNASATTFFTLGTFSLVLAILYVGREVFLPLALSILLTALLAPLVRRVERSRVPRIAAVLIVVSLVTTVFLSVAGIIGRQAVDLSGELKNYQYEIRHKFKDLREQLRAWKPSEDMQESIEMLEEMSEEEGAEAASGAAGPLVPGGTEGTPRKPIPVRVIPEESSTLDGLRELLSVVMAPLGLVAMVVVLTIFMLIAREDLRNRMLVLIGGDRVPGTTQLLEDAWNRVSRYLRMQLLINSMYGVAVFALTVSVGLPNALLFGLQATVMRFVPYLGPFIAAGLPLAVTLAVEPGWQSFWIVAGGLLILELIVNNVLEPWLYGSSTGVSTVGILISALFWTWLWGAIGLVLATPLTVCVVVLGKNVPALKFWATLLSEESPLGPIERLYQRLLARDSFEALRIIDEERKQPGGDSPAAACNLLAGAVTRAAVDFSAAEIDEDRLRGFSTAFDQVWEETLVELELPLENENPQGPRAICLPARGICDAHAAKIVSAFLQSEGWRSTAVETHLLARDVAAHAKDGNADVCVVAAFGGRASGHARYVCRQLTMQGWHGPIAVLVMPGEHLTAAELERLASAGAHEIVKSHAELSLKLNSLTQRARLDSPAAEANEADTKEAAVKT